MEGEENMEPSSNFENKLGKISICFAILSTIFLLLTFNGLYLHHEISFLSDYHFGWITLILSIITIILTSLARKHDKKNIYAKIARYVVFIDITIILVVALVIFIALSTSPY